jgi:hypothetical protein
LTGKLSAAKKKAVVSFTSRIQKFQKMGEKTGWTYIEIPALIANRLFPGMKKSFRVKGKLDNHGIAFAALLPMGDGNFILPFNAAMRKGTGKSENDPIKVTLEKDDRRFEMDKDFMQCLRDEISCYEFFKTLPGSHQRYFSKWISEARTPETKAKRIAAAMNAFGKKQGFQEMLRALKAERRAM